MGRRAVAVVYYRDTSAFRREAREARKLPFHDPDDIISDDGNSLGVIHLQFSLRRLLQALAWLAAAAVASACQDARGDPTALLVGLDAPPAVVFAADLPSLPGLTARYRLEPKLSSPAELWLGSWAVTPERGEELRVEAYAGAATRLALELGPEGVEEALSRLEVALASLERLDPAQLPDAVALRLAVSRQEATASRRALEVGELPDAVRATLHGADILRSVGPEGVARTLIARAERVLPGVTEGVDATARERAERLLYGAREAAANRDFGIAIQRAYYACQLLEACQLPRGVLE